MWLKIAGWVLISVSAIGGIPVIQNLNSMGAVLLLVLAACGVFLGINVLKGQAWAKTGSFILSGISLAFMVNAFLGTPVAYQQLNGIFGILGSYVVAINALGFIVVIVGLIVASKEK